MYANKGQQKKHRKTKQEGGCLVSEGEESLGFGGKPLAEQISTPNLAPGQQIFSFREEEIGWVTGWHVVYNTLTDYRVEVLKGALIMDLGPQVVSKKTCLKRKCKCRNCWQALHCYHISVQISLAGRTLGRGLSQCAGDRKACLLLLVVSLGAPPNKRPVQVDGTQCS